MHWNKLNYIIIILALLICNLNFSFLGGNDIDLGEDLEIDNWIISDGVVVIDTDSDHNEYIELHPTSDNNLYLTSRGGRPAWYYDEASNGLPTSRPGSANDAGWTGLAFGHLNSDNLLDLVCIGRKGSGAEVYLGNGLGTWTKSNTGITSTFSGRSDVRIVDLNKDNKNDIITSDSGFWQGDGAGKWSSFSAPPFSGEDVDYGDFNNDTHVDVAIVGHLTGGIKAFFGDSKGNWVETPGGFPGASTSSGGHKITVGDVNNDGYDDIISTYWYNSSAWLSDGKGNWTRKSAGIDQNTQFWGVDAGDINNDGNLDLVFGSFHSNAVPVKDGVRVYKGDGTGTWLERGTGLPTISNYGPVRLADMDLDGNLDIIAGENGATGGVYLYLGDGKFNFTEVDAGLPKDTTDEQEGLDVGDIDNNGYPDVGVPYYGPTGVEVWKYIKPAPIHLNLTSPNGGEKVLAGSDFNITWHCFGGILPINISLEYSVNGAAGPYYLIASDLENTGTYSWQVEKVISTNCYIRINATDHCKFIQVDTDLSNNSFEIFMIPLKSVELIPESAVVHKNDVKEFKVKVTDDDGAEIVDDLIIEWELSSTLGSIYNLENSNSTEFTALNYGTCELNVEVTYFQWKSSDSVTIIIAREPALITFNAPSVNLTLGQQRIVKAFVFNEDGFNMTALSQLTYSWKVLDPVVEIIQGENTNTVTFESTAIGAGELQVTVKYYGRELYAKLPLNVLPVAGSVLIQPQNTHVMLGDNKLLQIALYDESDFQIQIPSEAQILWTVDGPHGQVLPIENGATAWFKSAHYGSGWVEVNVDYFGILLTNRTYITIPQELDSLSATPQKATVYRGENLTIKLNGLDIFNDVIIGPIKFSGELRTEIGYLINSTEDDTLIFHATKPGTAIIYCKGKYYSSEAYLQVEVTVPPELKSLKLTPNNAIIDDFSPLTFEVKVYDTDGLLISDDVDYSWTLEDHIGSLNTVDHQNRIEFSPANFGSTRLKVLVTHFTKKMISNTTITVVPKLTGLEFEPEIDKMNVGESILINVYAFDDLGKKITEGLEFSWNASVGEITPIDVTNSSIGYKATTSGTIELTVYCSYYGTTIDKTLEIKVKRKASKSEEIGGTVLIASFGIITVVLFLIVLTFFLLKRKKERKGTEDSDERTIGPSLQKSSHTSISKANKPSETVIDYRSPTFDLERLQYHIQQPPLPPSTTTQIPQQSALYPPSGAPYYPASSPSTQGIGMSSQPEAQVQPQYPAQQQNADIRAKPTIKSAEKDDLIVHKD